MEHDFREKSEDGFFRPQQLNIKYAPVAQFLV